jgi:phage protein D
MNGSNVETLINHIEIKLGGAALDPQIARDLHTVEAISTLGLPDMAEIQLTDEKIELIDDTKFDLGKEIEILVKRSSTEYTTIFKGEIISIEPQFTEGTTALLIIRAMDKMHRLNRSTKTRVFVDTKDSDIVTKIAGEYGLSTDVDETVTLYPHVYQDNQNDFDFLHNIAQRNGFFLFSDMGKLCFKKKMPTSPVATLKWGIDLRGFHPRVTVAGQVNKVTVKGWDRATKKPVIGTAESSTSHSTTGFGSSGADLAKTKISDAERSEVRRFASTQADAEKMAQGILDGINAGSVEGDGVAFGNGKIRAGVLIEVKNVGTRFSGKYWITEARHVYNQREGYTTHFTIGGLRGMTLSGMSQGSSDDNVGRGALWAGVVPAIVTNNLDTKDNTNMGFVKIKFPWLDVAKESHWARLASPGAGTGGGMIWMPEVNDEVLVAFEAGDFNRPYIIGGLWNGTDALPQKQNELVVDGKVEVRSFQTRIGHIFRFTDKDGSEMIELLDGKQKTSIVMDTAKEKITVLSTKDIEIQGKSAGKIDILNDSGLTTIKNSSGGMTVESASGAINVKTTSGAINVTSASGAVSVKSSGGNVTVEGVSVEVKATGNMTVKGALVTVEASGVLTLKGSLVKIGS